MSLVAHDIIEDVVRAGGYRSDEAMSDAERAAWLASRAGKLTASRMKDAIDFKKDGSPTVKRSDYMRELLAERLTGYSTRHFVTSAMEWGIVTEPEAKVAYAVIANQKIITAEFIEHPSIPNFGATPDGLIGTEGLLEVKCPTTGTFTDWVMAGVVPEEHKPQMLAQLACTGRKWVEFVAYDPRLKDEKHRLFILRYQPEPKDITAIELHAQTFLNELQAMFDAFVSAA